jgi:hypothetical protein
VVRLAAEAPGGLNGRRGAAGPWGSGQVRLCALMLWLMGTKAFLVGLVQLPARR